MISILKGLKNLLSSECSLPVNDQLRKQMYSGKTLFIYSLRPLPPFAGICLILPDFARKTAISWELLGEAALFVWENGLFFRTSPEHGMDQVRPTPVKKYFRI